MNSKLVQFIIAELMIALSLILLVLVVINENLVQIIAVGILMYMSIKFWEASK